MLWYPLLTFLDSGLSIFHVAQEHECFSCLRLHCALVVQLYHVQAVDKLANLSESLKFVINLPFSLSKYQHSRLSTLISFPLFHCLLKITATYLAYLYDLQKCSSRDRKIPCQKGFFRNLDQPRGLYTALTHERLYSSLLRSFCTSFSAVHLNPWRPTTIRLLLYQINDLANRYQAKMDQLFIWRRRSMRGLSQRV